MTSLIIATSLAASATKDSERQMTSSGIAPPFITANRDVAVLQASSVSHVSSNIARASGGLAKITSGRTSNANTPIGLKIGLLNCKCS